MGIVARQDYIEGSYLTHMPAGPFDLAACIYCDFGALTPDQRGIFLDNVHYTLIPGGELILAASYGRIISPELTLRPCCLTPDSRFWR